MFLRSFLSRMDTIFRPGGKVFYGWYIVLAATGIQWLAAMTWMHSYGAYTTLLQADFGWSMSVLSWAFALTRLESGLLGPLQGWLVDRYGDYVSYASTVSETTWPLFAIPLLLVLIAGLILWRRLRRAT